MRKRPSLVTHRRPLAPERSGVVEPSGRAPAGIRWLSNVMDAVSPSTLGALAASTTAWLSGLDGGGDVLPLRAPWAMPGGGGPRAAGPGGRGGRRAGRG